MDPTGGPSWLDLACLVLAAGACVDAWFGATLLAPARRAVLAREARAARDGREPPPWVGATSCPSCFSFHATWAIMTLLLAAWACPAWAVPLKAPLHVLAAYRAGLLLNALLPERARYPEEFPEADTERTPPWPES